MPFISRLIFYLYIYSARPLHTLIITSRLWQHYSLISFYIRTCFEVGIGAAVLCLKNPSVMAVVTGFLLNFWKIFVYDVDQPKFVLSFVSLYSVHPCLSWSISKISPWLTLSVLTCFQLQWSSVLLSTFIELLAFVDISDARPSWDHSCLIHFHACSLLSLEFSCILQTEQLLIFWVIFLLFVVTDVRLFVIVQDVIVSSVPVSWKALLRGLAVR